MDLSPRKLFPLLLTLLWPTGAAGQLQDEATSCQLATALANDALDATVGECAAYRSGNCQVSTISCGGCNFVVDQSVSAFCTDDCPYTYEGLTVTRGTSSNQYIIFTAVGAVLPYGVGSFYAFAAGGKEGTANLNIVQVDSETTTCDAKFNNEDCPCEFFDCGPQVDCSAIPGGAVLDFCQSDIGVIVETGKALADYTDLEQLVLVPELACGGGDAGRNEDGATGDTGDGTALDDGEVQGASADAGGGGANNSSGTCLLFRSCFGLLVTGTVVVLLF